jgi:periplasmic copper chaperone A
MQSKALLSLSLVLSLGAAPVLAQEFKAGDIVIEKPWARATPKGAEVGGAFFVVKNNGAAPDKLTGGSADFATLEIHQTTSENGVSAMRQLTDGLTIPAHGSVAFAPGGYHLMLTHLTHALIKGDSVKATLTFEHAGSIPIEFNVVGIGAGGGSTGGSMGSMKGMKM